MTRRATQRCQVAAHIRLHDALREVIIRGPQRSELRRAPGPARVDAVHSPPAVRGVFRRRAAPAAAASCGLRLLLFQLGGVDSGDEAL